MRKNIIALAAVSFFFFACEGKKEDAKVDVRVIKVEDLQKDFKLPESLWKLLAAEGSVQHKDNQIIFVPMQVELVQKNDGVLKAEKFVIELPRGGGVIDLAQWIAQESGTFYIKFNMTEIEKAEQFQVFFLSQSRRRKIADEILGMGCNKYIELGASYFNAMKESGLALNTTRNRHVTVSGGRWFFIARDQGKTYLSQVAITDTNQKELFCEDAWTGN